MVIDVSPADKAKACGGSKFLPVKHAWAELHSGWQSVRDGTGILARSIRSVDGAAFIFTDSERCGLMSADGNAVIRSEGETGADRFSSAVDGWSLNRVKRSWWRVNKQGHWLHIYAECGILQDASCFVPA